MTKERLATLLKQAYEEGWNDGNSMTYIPTHHCDYHYKSSATKAMADSLDKVDYFLVADAEKMVGR